MKIIVDERTESHMLCHEHDFFYGWKATFDQVINQENLDHFKETVEKLEVIFDKPIGYCSLVETDEEDEIIYAKRLERDLYTRFVKGRKPTEVNQVMVIFRKVEEEQDTYRLVTMYPGFPSEKEPQDLNISSKEELMRSLKFWSKRALIYDEQIIEPGSDKAYCPYRNLYYIFD